MFDFWPPGPSQCPPWTTKKRLINQISNGNPIKPIRLRSRFRWGDLGSRRRCISERACRGRTRWAARRSPCWPWSPAASPSWSDRETARRRVESCYSPGLSPGTRSPWQRFHCSQRCPRMANTRAQCTLSRRREPFKNKPILLNDLFEI